MWQVLQKDARAGPGHDEWGGVRIRIMFILWRDPSVLTRLPEKPFPALQAKQLGWT